MNEETHLKIDSFETRAKACESFKKCIEESNKIWHSVLRLIITLSSSFLVITIAVVEKLFPPAANVITLPKFVIFSWILLFVSIIFGIIAELNEAIFFANQATADANKIKTLNKKIEEGKDTYTYTEDSETSYITYGSIKFGVISINSFMIAILCLCTALLSKIEGFNLIVCIIILVLGMFFFGCMTYYLVKKLKEEPTTTQSNACDKSQC